MDSGIAHEGLNELLSILNVPAVFRNTIVRAQDRVGKAVSSVAKQSCVGAIHEEKRLTLDRSAR